MNRQKSYLIKIKRDKKQTTLEITKNHEQIKIIQRDNVIKVVDTKQLFGQIYQLINNKIQQNTQKISQSFSILFKKRLEVQIIRYFIQEENDQCRANKMSIHYFYNKSDTQFNEISIQINAIKQNIVLCEQIKNKDQKLAKQQTLCQQNDLEVGIQQKSQNYNKNQNKMKNISGDKELIFQQNQQNKLQSNYHNYQINQKTQQKIKRKDNTLISNVIRSLKSITLHYLKCKPQAKSYLQKYYAQAKINYQIYSFHLICMGLLYIKEKLSLINQNSYLRILEYMKDKVQTDKNNILLTKTFDQDKINNIFNGVLQHFNHFYYSNLSFDDLTNDLGNQLRKQLFDKLLVKKQGLKQKFMIQSMQRLDVLKKIVLQSSTGFKKQQKQE